MNLLEDDELPLLLPEVESYQPTDTGESPLAAIEAWVNTPRGRRETDTMPNWAGSCWYWLRFMDPHNEACFASMERQRYWGQVDIYVGGTEHLCLHDLYARFWMHALHDLGRVAEREPFRRLLHQGMVLDADGKKMSKSRGGGQSPDEILETHGADVLRLHLNFLGPPEASKLWNRDSLDAMRRFLDRLGMVFDKVADVPLEGETERLLHVTIRGVERDYEAHGFNTVIAKLMEFTNHLMKCERVPRAVVRPILTMLSPQAPHFADEMGERMGLEGLVSEGAFPAWDPEKVLTDEVEIPLQVNGKVRDVLRVPRDADAARLEEIARSNDRVRQSTEGKTIRKVIVVPGKIVNVVAG